MNNTKNPIEILIRSNYKYRSFDRFRNGESIHILDLLRLIISGLFFEPLEYLIFNFPGTLGITLRKISCKIFCGNIGKRVLIDRATSFSGFSNIYIDDYVWIDRNVELLADTGYINIGKRVHIAPHANIVGLSGVIIEDYAAIGRYAQVLSHSVVSESGKYMSGPMVSENEKGSKSEAVVIRRNAVISSGAIIMPGVEIGEGAIIGPNSLILTNVKPWNIMLGVPARAVGIRESF